jgi:hypothetical protein
MKKIVLLLMVIFFCVGATHAQRLLIDENFESTVGMTADSLPAGWAKFKVLTPGLCTWAVWGIRDSGQVMCATNALCGYLTKSHPPGKRALNIPWTANSGTQTDDWVFTKSVSLLANDSLLFWMQLGSYPCGGVTYYWDSCQIWVSTNQNPTGGTKTKLGTVISLPAATNFWQNIKYNLTAFAGQTVYIGFRYYMYTGVDGIMVNLDDVFVGNHAPSGVTYPVPELIYYKFEDNPTSTTIKNFASAPVGTNPATITGHVLGTGGMVDSCIIGTTGAGANGITTGWSWNVTGNWTMAFWVSNLLETSSGSPTYLFGDAGASSFRCFYGGAAYPNNMYFRGAFSTTGYLIACPMPGSYMFHIVYNGSAYTIYRNGVQLMTNASTTPVGTGTGFKVTGYGTTSYSLNAAGKMDEFRLYNRALTPTEISATWNVELPATVNSTGKISNNIPDKYDLSQNYPNPFNPVTKISFDIPKSGFVSLKVYDVLGKEVKTLVNEVKNPGSYTVNFNASAFSSGTYFYRLESNGFVSTKKMLLIK